jgi:hypothetical protein
MTIISKIGRVRFIEVLLKKVAKKMQLTIPAELLVVNDQLCAATSARQAERPAMAC